MSEPDLLRRQIGAVLVSLWLLAGPLSAEDPPEVGVTHALLINGGSRPTSNYQSHLHHLQEMWRLLSARGLPSDRIHIFSADGADEGLDLAVRDALPESFWLIEGTRAGKVLKPRTEITDTRWPGVTLHPARKSALEKWFHGADDILPGDRLLIFVTDHGTQNRSDPDNGAISLWQEKLTVEELKGLLGRLSPGVKTVMVMSQCYSGSFAATIYDDPSAEPGGEACGFFSTTRDRKAYGCYPEGRDRDRMGHAFRFIDALGRRATTDRAHLDVLLTDSTPDVPLRTSDLYLERLLAEEAVARGLDPDSLVDSLLAQAWHDRGAWEPEIRLLDRVGEAFGTFSPRSLAELKSYEEELPPLVERMREFARLWESTLVDVKEETLGKFARELPKWQGLLQPDHLNELNAEEKDILLGQLLAQLEGFARERLETWERLEGLRERSSGAAKARWRLEVRGSALRRVRSILVGVAGQVLISVRTDEQTDAPERSAQRRAFASLLNCETLEPGELPWRLSALEPLVIEPFPTLASELRLLEEVLPSWLGVRYSAVPKEVRAGRQLLSGANWLQAVYPESPAMAAGLEIGDIVLGPPERPFDFEGQLREWTMTSRRGTPLPLRVLRPGADSEDDREFVASLLLRSLPVEWPELPGPPQVGDAAPALPSGLVPVDSDMLPALEGRPHLLFFWATWCLPCKKAVPEVMAFAATEGLPVLAISDEDADIVGGYLDKLEEGFFERVAVDPLRKSFISFGVSGTPTIVLVDGEGVVRHRQVGYKPSEGLSVEGWRWSGS